MNRPLAHAVLPPEGQTCTARPLPPTFDTMGSSGPGAPGHGSREKGSRSLRVVSKLMTEGWVAPAGVDGVAPTGVNGQDASIWLAKWTKAAFLGHRPHGSHGSQQRTVKIRKNRHQRHQRLLSVAAPADGTQHAIIAHAPLLNLKTSGQGSRSDAHAQLQQWRAGWSDCIAGIRQQHSELLGTVIKRVAGANSTVMLIDPAKAAQREKMMI